MKEDERISRWVHWLGEIRREAQELLMSREVYVEVRNIIASNPEIRTDNRLYSWMTWTYIHSMLVGVRRLMDNRDDVISLVRLINDMEEHPDLLSRARHSTLYSEGPPGLADATFDGLAGEGAAFFPTERLRTDRELLQSLWKPLKTITNKKIAHLDHKHRDLKEPPRFGEVDELLDEIEAQVRRYTLVLEAKDFYNLAPTPQYDWKAVFRVAWLPPAKKRKKIGQDARRAATGKDKT